MIAEKTYSYILFDLDGTLTDPMEGITRSVQYALSYFGIEVNDLKQLCRFIGPPLKESFMRYYQLSDTQAEAAVAKYRERFADTGIFENKLYPGMVPFLHTLREAGKKAMLATSKPTVYADRILEHFGLKKYFDFVGGSNLDGSRVHKDEVIRYVLERNGIRDLSSAVMIGDRKYDIEGARRAGIDSVGVLYGYGSRDELEKAGAVYLASGLPDLSRWLGVAPPEKEDQAPSGN